MGKVDGDSKSVGSVATVYSHRSCGAHERVRGRRQAVGTGLYFEMETPSRLFPPIHDADSGLIPLASLKPTVLCLFSPP